MDKNVHEYFRQAWRRLATRTDLNGCRGPIVFGPDGLCAAFEVCLEQGRIARADYRCTTCVTLVALCEHLSELAVGMHADDISRLRPELLLERHPEVPPGRQDRAALALTAFTAAVKVNQRN